MEAARDLSHDLVSRDWQEYADACLCHDRAEPAVCHAKDLANGRELVSATASTNLNGFKTHNKMWVQAPVV